ncbi:MAG TPA: hypothetical protein DCM67_00545 [Propionibacteriaceae bacterium]|nr:hypothetical protein [Propionibacteriaceae bacterium]
MIVDHSDEAEPVPVQVLREAGVQFRLHRHPAARNADELHLTGLSVEYSAKTLAFLLPDDRVLLAAIPGAARLRYPLLARAVGIPRSALRPAPPDRLSALGMTPGGVTIFTRDHHAVVAVHAGLLELPRIYCGSGWATLTVELSPDALRGAVADPVIADLCSPGLV